MDLFAGVETLKGIGPKSKAMLEKAGIKTVRDLIYFLPRTYENYAMTTELANIRPGKVVIKGKISDLRTNRTSRRNLSITEGIIRDNTDAIRVVWFNQPYRAKQFDKNKDYYFVGNYDFSYGRYQLTSPTARLAEEVDNQTGGLQPVYPARGNFKSTNFKKIFDNLRNNFALIPDMLPIIPQRPKFIKHGARADALFKVHYAENLNEAEDGRRYLAYEELFELILAANLNKIENQRLKSIPLKFNPDSIKELVKKLPFNLTNAQRKAAFQILKDMEKDTPMNRLLQGDVGSGKTVVAAIAAFEAAINGYQSALLAPTAILAAQHAEALEKLLSPFGISVSLLTSATKRKDVLKKRIKEGNVNLVIGTHAILTDDTEFKSLALCIIDEQHRFGVEQRQKLLTKASAAPHLLMMTATPIPRSLQLTIFGDLNVSILDELPAGRQPVKTKIISEINFVDELYPKIHDYLNKKQQVYWICKTIEDGSKAEAISVKKQTEKLKKIFPKNTIVFIHGRMKADEKDEIMNNFANGKIDILVSTTVVEVGVNVPNANLMVIMNADEYGLAQLHQLRGRIGRGKDAAICFLVNSPDSEPTRRLKIIEKSNDGFYLAEADLKLRGPGEIYGSLQHGALDLRFASLTDSKLISIASENAKTCATAFAKNPELMVKYPELSICIKKYQQLTTLN